MKLALKHSFFDADENCTFENDKLNRRTIAENLTNILRNSETNAQGLILALNAQWGNGKTTFIKMWKNMLDKEMNGEIPNLYFSAWEEDYTKEPLIALLGELNRYLEDKEKQNKNFNQAVELVQKIFKRTLPTLLKVSVKGLFNKIGIDNELLQEASQILTEDSAKTLIENYSKEKECLAQLRENLTKVFEATGAKEGQPFIVFVDEIDRCRPTYAIEMLEHIKHLFGIPNLVFVISIDKAQLSKSIQAIYGQIDTDNYLRRFFDLEFILPNPSPKNFCIYLKEKLKIQEDIENIFIADNFTLRELQKILPQIKLLEVQRLQDNNEKPIFDMEHAIFILLIKIYKPDLYSQIPNITDAKGIMEVVEKLMCKEKEAINDNSLFKYITIVYRLCNKISWQDKHFLEFPFPTQDRLNKWFREMEGKPIYIDFNLYSYIVQAHCGLFARKRSYLNLHEIKINWREIIKAIDFTSQFDIQES